MSSPRARVRARPTAALGLLLGILLAGAAVTGSARLPRADCVWNNGQELTSLDPAAVTGVPEGRVMVALYEGLVTRHPATLEPLPGMAASWEVSSDGRVYTFRLRPEARWSNGDPLTAHDFEWSWQRLLAPETAAEYVYQLWYLEGAEDFSLTPVDVAGERWWFDDELFLHASDERPDSLRVGRHRFAAGGSVPTAGELAARLGIPAERVRPNPDRAPGTDPYLEGWLAELDLAGAAPESVAARVGGFRDAATARSELFWPRVGARALDAHTFRVTLRAPTPYFLDLCGFYPLFPVHRPSWEHARATWPDSWQVEWLRPERLVTNGPYVLVERRINDRLRLRKNPHYWDRNGVAMETIDVLAVEHYGTMLNLYLTGEVDWLDRCAPNLIPRMLPREDFDPAPYLGSYFYRFNTTRPPLDDPRVRRALALAVDRRALCEKITKNGEQPLWSLCPDGLRGYARREMPHADPGPGLAAYDAAYARDCEEARALLAAAGYGPGGRPLRALELLYNTSEVHRDLAEVVADTWKRALDVDVKLLNQEWKVYLDSQKSLDYDVCRAAWIGDYPDPNTFLDIFVTGSENNRTGWSDGNYDALVRAAAAEADAARRMQLLAEAEEILMEALPILPLYGYASQNVVNPRLGGFHPNVQDVHYPKFFYWMDDAELAARRAARTDGAERAPAPGPAWGLYPPDGRTIPGPG